MHRFLYPVPHLISRLCAEQTDLRKLLSQVEISLPMVQYAARILHQASRSGAFWMWGVRRQ